MGVVGSIVGVIFGVFWTIMATFFSSGMPQPMKTVFPLFGVLFIIVGIANVIYNLYNTTAKKRLSVFDITSQTEEPDPLNHLFGQNPLACPRKSGRFKSRVLGGRRKAERT